MVTRPFSLRGALTFAFMLLSGCNAGIDNGGDVDGGGDGGGSAGPTIPGCVGACRVRTDCPAAMGPTTISGTVTIPAGTLPLYNAKVFIPTGTTVPTAPPSGASCDRCDAQQQVFSTTTDINGRFTLKDVPSGSNIPLVIRVGKWQRTLTLPTVADCTQTALPAAETRLPRNRTEGNIPRMALSTGSADALECLLRSKKLGLDDSEFTVEGGPGRVNLYGGANGTNSYTPALGGATFTTAQSTPTKSWWDDAANWNKYDIVILSCEGGQHMEVKSDAALQNLERYIGLGGRVFASHWHNGWIANAKAPQKIQGVATFPNSGAPGTVTAKINLNYVRGAALAEWLVLPTVWGAGNPPARGDLPLAGAKNTIGTTAAALTQTWVTYNNVPQYFSFNAPIGAPASQQCGQMVFTDLHVSSGAGGGDTSARDKPFPTGCTAGELSAQEKALIFMLFDLTNCLDPILG